MPVADNSNPYFRLRNAIEEGDCVRARKALADGAPVSKLDIYGMRPVHMAAMAGEPAILKILAEYGAPLDERSEDGETIFDFIVKPQVSAKQLQAFLGISAKWDFGQFRNRSGQTPLHLAARALLPQHCAVLLAAGDSPNALDNAKNNPAHAVAAKQDGPGAGARELLELLLASGTDFRHRAQQGRTPFIQACVTAGASVLEAFLAVDPEGAEVGLGRGMELACEYDNAEAVGLLLSKGLIRPDTLEYFGDLAEEHRSTAVQEALRTHIASITLEQEIPQAPPGPKSRI